MRELERIESMYNDILKSIIIEGDDGCVYLTNIFKNPHSISMVESLLNSFKSCSKLSLLRMLTGIIRIYFKR